MVDFFNEEYAPPTELMDMQELLEFEYARKLDKRSKEYKSWKFKYNHLVMVYNKSVKFPCYTQIK